MTQSQEELWQDEFFMVHDDEPLIDDDEDDAEGMSMLKLGMEPIPGVSRVTIEKSNNSLFVFSNPDIFKCTNSDTYVIFGEPKIEDLSSQLQTQAAEQFETPNVGNAAVQETEPAILPLDDDVDESGVDPEDIELVMTQAGVSRARAVKALNDANGDVIFAIVSFLYPPEKSSN